MAPHKAPRIVGEKVKSLRASAGMTQQELAKRLGVDVPTISRIETGSKTKVLRVRDLPRLAKALGVKPSDLVRPLDAA